jgi:exodeoxyribonuclease VII small subunit
MTKASVRIPVPRRRSKAGQSGPNNPQIRICYKLDARAFSIYSFAVPNPSKSAGQNNPAKTPPFEEALRKLEGVVEAMEADDLPLETLLTKYEEGTKLVKICQEKLAEAELKIQQLEKNAAGEMKLKPLDLKEEL